MLQLSTVEGLHLDQRAFSLRKLYLNLDLKIEQKLGKKNREKAKRRVFEVPKAEKSWIFTEQQPVSMSGVL